MADNTKAIAAAKEFIATLDPEAAKEFEGLGESALAYMGNGVLRQSEFTKNQTALKQDRDELDKWQKKANQQYGDMKEQNIKMQAQVAEAEARLNSLATEFGVDVSEIKAQQVATGQSADVAAANVQRQGGQAVEGANGNADPKEWQDYANQTAETMASIALEAADIVGDHRDMFDSRISAMELAKEAYQAGKPVREYWKEKYDVDAKQAEMDAAAKAKWEEDIRADAKEQTRRELIAEGATLQPVASANLNSPLFDPDFGKDSLAGKGDGEDGEGRAYPKGPRSDRDRMAVVAAAAKAFETEGLPRATSSGDATGY